MDQAALLPRVKARLVAVYRADTGRQGGQAQLTDPSPGGRHKRSPQSHRCIAITSMLSPLSMCIVVLARRQIITQLALYLMAQCMGKRWERKSPRYRNRCQCRWRKSTEQGHWMTQGQHSPISLIGWIPGCYYFDPVNPCFKRRWYTSVAIKVESITCILSVAYRPISKQHKWCREELHSCSLI